MPQAGQQCWHFCRSRKQTTQDPRDARRVVGQDDERQRQVHFPDEQVHHRSDAEAREA